MYRLMYFPFLMSTGRECRKTNPPKTPELVFVVAPYDKVLESSISSFVAFDVGMDVRRCAAAQVDIQSRMDMDKYLTCSSFFVKNTLFDS